MPTLERATIKIRNMEKNFFTVAYLRMTYQMLQFRLSGIKIFVQKSIMPDSLLDEFA
ncbi:MAG TPA: hypothetical protein VEF04_21970 [Blastocatellia bacterium]|nr:hypothetical protein [Blastocatellia bacterium]